MNNNWPINDATKIKSSIQELSQQVAASRQTLSILLNKNIASQEKLSKSQNRLSIILLAISILSIIALFFINYVEINAGK